MSRMHRIGDRSRLISEFASPTGRNFHQNLNFTSLLNSNSAQLLDYDKYFNDSSHKPTSKFCEFIHPELTHGC